MKKGFFVLMFMMSLSMCAFRADAEEELSACVHVNMRESVYYDYEAENSVFHRVYKVEEKWCPDCYFHEEIRTEEAYEEHAFTVYASDGRYCFGCGCKDEFYQ